ncbi:hypothetical protein FB45DRAFT_1034117 [Roridomyces roridus]|uniref:F-box domain-containing protein n=1 Tax=Roridomyces roridus TaxID=1738132 RepID=A0AAD7FGU5_9AGAR|nr:hypothetical protein FB45DRAFT_1034117 [Roridomyces roridus]
MTVSLDLFPTELWLECWLYAPKRRLRRLSLVCRLFRSLCLPLLIEGQTADIAALADGYSRLNWIHRTHALHRTAVRLDRLAALGADGLASSVREWTVSSPPPLLHQWTMPPNVPAGLFLTMLGIPPIDRFDGLRQRVLQRFFANIGIFRNLRCLSLRGISVNADARCTLAALLNLAELSLDRCDITPRDGMLLKLQRFTISAPEYRAAQPTATEALEIVDPRTLTHLNLHSTCETHAFLAGCGQPEFPRLIYLSLHPLFDANTLLLLLERSPQLQSLILRSISPGLALEIDASFVPDLHTLTTSLKLLPAFMHLLALRRVTVVANSDETIPIEDFKEAFSGILDINLGLRFLTLPATTCTAEALACIATVFPGLTSLSINISELVHVVGGIHKEPRYHATQRAPVQAVELQLDDENAFAGVCPDELSSESEDEDEGAQSTQSRRPAHKSLWAEYPDGVEVEIPLPDNPSGTYTDLLRRLAHNLIALPSSLKILHLIMPGLVDMNTSRQHRSWYHTAQEEAVVAALARQGLREVRLARGDSWKVSSGGEVDRILRL